MRVEHWVSNLYGRRWFSKNNQLRVIFSSLVEVDTALFQRRIWTNNSQVKE
jgi:hypothetical protein